MSQRLENLDDEVYAVIFTSVLGDDITGYEEMAKLMLELASHSEGFLSVESARNEIGITVSYWKGLNAIKQWKQDSEHQIAQQFGKQKWYSAYKVSIAKVEKEYSFNWDE
ncbi:antibiotic biosynthesis monooxygenase [Shewanella sp. 202IG2-18]|uniref:antibiotic biosynthesis monooxygenase family protein n=1 Tax=Parashewanella hymeniacidonis TaxID=2807618 RepID=UPI00195FDCE7|nr:antibiotic biosynthesis monooxygenase [Parashewanella hymeniacidonis]MBM7073872.1 antibiotic biosynthesis monooxygenase [Parashewanella hymeniacidonis]